MACQPAAGMRRYLSWGCVLLLWPVPPPALLSAPAPSPAPAAGAVAGMQALPMAEPERSRNVRCLREASAARQCPGASATSGPAPPWLALRPWGLVLPRHSTRRVNPEQSWVMLVSRERQHRRSLPPLPGGFPLPPAAADACCAVPSGAGSAGLGFGGEQRSSRLVRAGKEGSVLAPGLVLFLEDAPSADAAELGEGRGTRGRPCRLRL